MKPGISDEEKQGIQLRMVAASDKARRLQSVHSSDEEEDEIGDDRDYQGKIRTKGGHEVGISSFCLSELRCVCFQFKVLKARAQKKLKDCYSSSFADLCRPNVAITF